MGGTTGCLHKRSADGALQHYCLALGQTGDPRGDSALDKERCLRGWYAQKEKTVPFIITGNVRSVINESDELVVLYSRRSTGTPA